MINDGDKIAVCMSGGKDSMLLAKLMQQLKRISDTDFELVFLVMNPGYNEANKKKILESNPHSIDVFYAIEEMEAIDYSFNLVKLFDEAVNTFMNIIELKKVIYFRALSNAGKKEKMVNKFYFHLPVFVQVVVLCSIQSRGFDSMG